MKAVRQKKIVIIHCDAPGQALFTRGKRKGLEICELSRLDILKSNSRKGAIQLEPRVHYPVKDEKDFPKLDDLDGVVIPGSIYNTDKESVEKTDWLKRLIGFIRKVHDAQRPMLGMCFGHQAIGAAFGVVSVRLDKISAEIGSHPVMLTGEGKGDILFKEIPEVFSGAFFHYQHVPRLPEGASHLAKGENCEIQAFRMGETTWGVQFHPDYNLENLGGLVEIRKDIIKEVLGNGSVRLEDTADNCRVFENFLNIARES